MNTKFAPAERVHPATIEQQNATVEENNTLTSLINSLSQMVIILNKERQIVYANKPTLEFIKATDLAEVIGKRVGEAIHCIHSTKEGGGCGTSIFCRTCGALNPILESQKGIQSTQECRILTVGTSALDLRITAAPFELNGNSLTIFNLVDISNEKRRQNLEQVFFHDVLNIAGGISGLSGLLNEINDLNEVAELSQLIKRASDNLIEEIQLQRQLAAAERGDLDLKIDKINSSQIVTEVKALYANHEIVKDKKITIMESSEEFIFSSDKVLLRRILGNMVKNAIEASLSGQTVSLRCSKLANRTTFSVHNKCFIPERIQHQLFQRSFSTKGTGRGIGTYSMKLLGEKYLKGNVWFESTCENGTTFYFAL